MLGHALILDGRPITVVGILPENFHFPLQFPEPDIWLPGISDPPSLRAELVRSGASYLNVVGRLRSGESLKTATAELETIDSSYRRQFPGFADAEKFGISAVPLAQSLVAPVRLGLIVLLAAAGFILIIACSNIANLLLARATSREREIAIRKALGASNVDLVRQLLIEGLLLSFFGGAVGVVLAAAALPTLRSFSPGSVPRLQEARLDFAVLIFSAAVSAVSGMVFGLVPALQGSGSSLQEGLRESARGSTAGRRAGKLRGLLIVGEMAIALILMTGAGLLMQTFSKIMTINPGFSAPDLMTFVMTLPPARYAQAEIQRQFYRRLLESVRTTPSIEAAGLTSFLPLSGSIRFVYFCTEGSICQGVGKDPLVALRQVTPDYFQAMRTPLLQGRVFNNYDTESSPFVVIVNQTIANHYWPGQNPIGKHLANSRDMIQREVVGVVADVKFAALNVSSSEEMYLPLEQSPWLTVTLVVRDRTDAAALVRRIRAQIAAIDPSLSVSNVLAWNLLWPTLLRSPCILATFVSVFAGFAAFSLESEFTA